MIKHGRRKLSINPHCGKLFPSVVGLFSAQRQRTKIQGVGTFESHRVFVRMSMPNIGAQYVWHSMCAISEKVCGRARENRVRQS